MRQDALRQLAAFFVGASALAWPRFASAAVVWTATFEAGTLAEWQPGVNGTKGTRKNVEVLGEQVYSGKFAGKVTVHPDDTFTFNQNRVDIQHQSTLTAEGRESWLSGHYMMPEDAKVRNQIAFYESNSSFQNVMDFWVMPKTGGGTTINFGVGFLGGPMPIWTADFTAGVWHQVAIHVLWSTNAATGTVDVWFDGTQVVTGRKAKTKADANTLFFQTGLHRSMVANFTDTIYLDDFIEADNLADAKIARPIGPGDAGVGDAAGTGADGAGAGGSGAGGSGAAMDAGMAAGGASGAGGATGAGAGGATGAGTGGATGAGTGGATGAGSGSGGTTGAGATGTAGSTSGTGSTGTATTGGAGGASTGATTGTGSGAAPDATSGCSCRVLATRDRTPTWYTAALLLAGAMAARRRRRQV